MELPSSERWSAGMPESQPTEKPRQSFRPSYSKVKEVLAEFHQRHLRRHIGINNIKSGHHSTALSQISRDPSRNTREEIDIPWLPWTGSPGGWRYTPSIIKRHQPWWMTRQPTFSGHFKVLRERQSNQGQNFDSRLLQEVLQLLGIRKTQLTLLHIVGSHGWMICKDGRRAPEESNFDAPQSLD